MASVREKFVERFGEDQAVALERAANGHGNGINDRDKGSDPFRWVLCICIGYQCAELSGYREYHKITAPWSEVKQWIVEHGDLAHHDGDIDYISVLTGAYEEFVTPKEASHV